MRKTKEDTIFCALLRSSGQWSLRNVRGRSFRGLEGPSSAIISSYYHHSMIHGLRIIITVPSTYALFDFEQRTCTETLISHGDGRDATL